MIFISFVGCFHRFVCVYTLHMYYIYIKGMEHYYILDNLFSLHCFSKEQKQKLPTILIDFLWWEFFLLDRSSTLV